MTTARSFVAAAVAAFPIARQAVAGDAVRALDTHLDYGYRTRSTNMDVLGEQIRIPDRLHFQNLVPAKLGAFSVTARCLISRATNGYLRQAALRSILDVDFPWAIPFVVLLAGDYVVEIVEDIRAALPTLNQAVYANFVSENRPMMRVLRARTISYWNCYYRAEFPERKTYPGLIVLQHLEQWAG